MAAVAPTIKPQSQHSKPTNMKSLGWLELHPSNPNKKGHGPALSSIRKKLQALRSFKQTLQVRGCGEGVSERGSGGVGE